MLRTNLLAFFLLHRQLTLEKSVELSQRKDQRSSLSLENCLADFEECLCQSNLKHKEVFTWRESLNFLSKLLNSQLITKEKLIKKATELQSSLYFATYNGFVKKVLAEIKDSIGGGHSFSAKSVQGSSQ